MLTRTAFGERIDLHHVLGYMLACCFLLFAWWCWFATNLMRYQLRKPDADTLDENYLDMHLFFLHTWF